MIILLYENFNDHLIESCNRQFKGIIQPAPSGTFPLLFSLPPSNLLTWVENTVLSELGVFVPSEFKDYLTVSTVWNAGETGDIYLKIIVFYCTAGLDAVYSWMLNLEEISRTKKIDWLEVQILIRIQCYPYLEVSFGHPDNHANVLIAKRKLFNQTPLVDCYKLPKK